MKLIEQIPWPVNCAVIVGTPAFATVVKWFTEVNPIMQFLAFLVAILWGAFQIWIAYRRKSWRRHGR